MQVLGGGDFFWGGLSGAFGFLGSRASFFGYPVEVRRFIS